MATYLRPACLEEALQAVSERPRTLLAGGTDHFPARAVFEPDEDILDLSGIAGLREVTLRDGEWRIPALAAWTDVAEAPLPPQFDGLRQAALQVGGRQIQNTGTLVGNVCNASPAADGIPALLALDAAVELRSRSGRRVLPLAEFVLGPRRTARRADEIVTALLVPERDASSVFLKLGGRRYLVISIAMVAVTVAFGAGGLVSWAGVAVGACGPRAVRLPALEAALLGHVPAPGLVRPEHLAPLTPIDDIRATAAFRMEAVLELLRRALGSLPQPARAA